MLVGGLVAFGVHKMSQKDAARIEEHTGVNPEELEDDELAKAMAELGIPDEKVTEADMAGADAAQAAPPPPAAPAPAGGAAPTDIEQLQQLASLRDAGILTEEEFAAKKAQILGLS
jgi:Short C-terminal domain